MIIEKIHHSTYDDDNGKPNERGDALFIKQWHYAITRKSRTVFYMSIGFKEALIWKMMASKDRYISTVNIVW